MDVDEDIIGGQRILFYHNHNHLLYPHCHSNYEPLVDGNNLMGDVHPIQDSQTIDTTVPLGITIGHG